tara:strand:+ start:942 stop:1169 length:228 start_codon:yes stop_codon:yes gene_type:complete
MDIHICNERSHELDPLKLQKMVFLYNALENGWTINKKKNLYIFSKNHEGKKEVFLDNYIKRFMKENFDIEKLLGK